MSSLGVVSMLRDGPLVGGDNKLSPDCLLLLLSNASPVPGVAFSLAANHPAQTHTLLSNGLAMNRVDVFPHVQKCQVFVGAWW